MGRLRNRGQRQVSTHVLSMDGRINRTDTEKVELWRGDFAVATSGLENVELEWDPRPSVCVVLASGGYPGPYEKGKIISGLEDAATVEDAMVFHAGTALKYGKVVTTGGRVLGVTARGDSVQAAIDRAYEAVSKISFPGMQFRTDIGAKAAKHLK